MKPYRSTIFFLALMGLVALLSTVISDDTGAHEENPILKLKREYDALQGILDSDLVKNKTPLDHHRMMMECVNESTGQEITLGADKGMYEDCLKQGMIEKDPHQPRVLKLDNIFKF